MSCRTVVSSSQLVCSSVELPKIMQRGQCIEVNTERFVKMQEHGTFQEADTCAKWHTWTHYRHLLGS